MRSRLVYRGLQRARPFFPLDSTCEMQPVDLGLECKLTVKVERQVRGHIARAGGKPRQVGEQHEPKTPVGEHAMMGGCDFRDPCHDGCECTDW